MLIFGFYNFIIIYNFTFINKIRYINVVFAKYVYIRLVDILIGYFCRLEDDSIRDNFVLIYELLEEAKDHGYPQTTDTKTFKRS